MRREVLKTYKDIFKLIYRIQDVGYRAELSQWARRDFKANKMVKEEVSECTGSAIFDSLIPGI